MAGEIARLFASLGFKVDESGLRKFQTKLEQTKRQIDSSGGLSGSFKRSQGAQSEFFREISKNYSKVRPNTEQMRKDLGRIDEAFRNNKVTYSEYAEARLRINEKLGQVEKQREVAHQKALNESQKAQEQSQKKAEQISKQRQTALDRVRKKLIQVEKRYDKHSAKLKEVRDDVSYVNREYRKGNVTLDQRKERVEQLIREYRRLQAAQAATAQTRIGSAGGIYAGGEDPRQVGNHRLISAIHSDTGLGIIAGGFAAAQSSRAFQEFNAMQQGLTAASGSSEKAAEDMEYLIGLSRELGLFVGDLGRSFSSFSAAARGSSLSSDEVRQTFEGVAAQARVLNLSAADTQGVMTALTQVMNKGQVMAEELKNQMGRLLLI